MRFGLSIGFEDWNRLRDLAQAAEELGFDAIYFPDHLLFEGMNGNPEPRHPALDPIVQAAVVAGATRRVRIGHLVLCNPFRHPAITARALVSLDELSGGRAIAGLGAGWAENEFRMNGLPFPDVATRLRMLDEALYCMRGLWTGEPFSHRGEFYRFDGALLLPRPVQRPHPPILIGGGGKRLVELAARHADVLNVVVETGRDGRVSPARMQELTDQAFRRKVGWLREAAARHGRNPGSIAIGHMISTATVADSAEAGRATIERIAAHLGLTVDAAAQSPALLLGTPEACVAELRRRERDWQCAEAIFTLSGLGGEAGLRRLAEKVLHHV